MRGAAVATTVATRTTERPVILIEAAAAKRASLAAIMDRWLRSLSMEMIPTVAVSICASYSLFGCYYTSHYVV